MSLEFSATLTIACRTGGFVVTPRLRVCTLATRNIADKTLVWFGEKHGKFRHV
ncbi:hypothetical protein MUO83_04370 [Candidatus Bathyarchaeota archaeon]|jgi:hypothetical protein|nr:hypothetical protein [Candidatus Bathyarchaeota archaeon]